MAAVLAVAVATLTGCAQYHAAPFTAEERAAAFDARTLDDPDLRAFLEAHLDQPLPLAAWNFTALTLVAVYFHPDLDVARAQWATAEAARITAGEFPNPSISVYPAFDTSRASPSPWLVTATLDVPIETAGKRHYRLSQAAHLSEAARLAIATVAWDVRSRLRRALVALYAASATVGLVERQRATQAVVVERLEAQLREGAVSPFDVAQARIGLDASQLALREAQRQYVDARAQVATALGVPAQALEHVDLALEGFADLPTELLAADLRREALLGRSDILSALRAYAAAEAALQLEIAKQYPDVHLNPGYEFDQGDNKWGFGLSLTLPAFNQNQGPIAEAEARRRAAAQQFVALQARVIGEVDRTRAVYRAALEKVATADTLVAHTTAQERTVREMIAAGELAGLTRYTTQLELIQNQIARLDAVVRGQEALGQLEDALQRPFDVSDPVWLAAPRREVAGNE
ncbi:TolC family protein [bacterium]|nr:TolC family protein [bacterium]